MPLIYALIAIVGVIGLIVLLLNFSVTVKARYDDTEGQMHCTLHFLWMTFDIIPAEKSKKKKDKNSKKEKKPDQDKKSSLQNICKENGISGFLQILQTTVSSLWSLIVSILSRSILKNLEIKLNITGEDAAGTAIMYGWANSVVYPIVGAILDNVSEYKDYNVQLTPDYSEGAESKIEADAEISIKLSKLIASVIECRSEVRKLLLVINRKSK